MIAGQGRVLRVSDDGDAVRLTSILGRGQFFSSFVNAV